MRIAVLALALLVTTGPVQARDHLGTHTSTSKVSATQRQAALSRNRTEYRRRMLQDGPSAADRWLDQQARATMTKSRIRPSTRTGKKNCKKVRWVKDRKSTRLNSSH